MLVLSVGATIFFGRVALRLGSSNFRLKLCHLSRNRPCHRLNPTITSSFCIIMRQLSVGAHAVRQNIEGTYEEAVRTLNTLQSNAAYIEKTKAERDKKRHLSIPDTIETAKRAGISLSDLDDLSVIHVSGTKGKGSTCAFIESILRTQGYKTGFFSSPHLVEVRERLRLDGRPISRDVFSSYFWECYKKLDATKGVYDGDMPTYFRFLTILAFHVFIKEKVDVAIMEVGIGGEFDCTNIVRNPVVCGVSSLGIDHTGLLGSTIDAIAWHKAGIFKTGVPAVTVPQPENSIQVLYDRAYEKGCPLYETPESIYDCDWGNQPKILGIPGEKQDLNAALAVTMCNIWMKNHTKDATARRHQYTEYVDKTIPRSQFIHRADQLALSESTTQGLTQCQWPGRCQTIERPGVTYYLDGAHTTRSIEVCADWFKEASQKEAKTKGGNVLSVLLFNATGDRQPETLLELLMDCNFDAAVFCPNIVSTISLNKADQTNYMVTNETQLIKCQNSQTAWLKLHGQVTKTAEQEVTSPLLGNRDKQEVTSPLLGIRDKQEVTSPLLSNGEKLPDTSDYTVCQQEQQHIPNESDSELVHPPNNNLHHNTCVCTATFGSILESLHWISQGNNLSLPQMAINVDPAKILQEADHLQVLCTGSLHLVGGILGLLEPDICDK